MANLKASKRDAVRSAKRRVANSKTKSTVRTYARNLRDLVAEGNLEQAREEFKACQRIFQKAGRSCAMHERRAARKLSRLSRLIHKATATAKA